LGTKTWILDILNYTKIHLCFISVDFVGVTLVAGFFLKVIFLVGLIVIVELVVGAFAANFLCCQFSLI
jgi:hypothetical protein